MWKLKRPMRQARPTFTTCIRNIRDQSLKQRLEEVGPTIEQTEVEYIDAAQSEQLNTISPLDNIGAVTNREMVSVYDRMIRSGSPGRPIYDELISATDHGRCPFCGHRTVSTLDHLLPKSKYSAFTVTPINLVPSCSDCNKAKFTAIPNTPEDVPFHPYFDNIEGDRWLYAMIVVNGQKPVSLCFFIRAPSNWNTLTIRRAEKHFNMLQLDLLYRLQAAQELQHIRHQLNRLLDAGGSDEVKKHLQDVASSRKNARLNSWQTATYEALAESDWYCAGGFR